MSQVGALYVDVGVRGLDQAAANLQTLGERLRHTGSQARDGLAGTLRGAISHVTGALGGIGQAAVSGFDKVSTAIMSPFKALTFIRHGIGAIKDALGSYGELLADDRAGEGVKNALSAFSELKSTVQDIILMASELIFTQTGLADGLDWVTTTLGELWDEWRPTIAAMIDTVTTLFSTLWDAGKTAFGAVREAFSSLMDFFGISLQESGETWAQTVKRWAEEFKFFVETFYLRLQIAWERFKLFISNSIERVRAFGKNVVVVLEWVWNNWREIFQTIGSFVTSVFRNAGENIRRIWNSVTDWIAGKGWKPPDLRPLTEGFRNTIKEMPKWVEANTRESTERLDQLLGELERRRAEFRDRIAARDAQIAQQQLLGGPQVPQAKGNMQQFGLVGFADLARRSQEDVLKALAERQAKAAEQAAAGIMEIAEAARGPGLRVRGMGARFE